MITEIGNRSVAILVESQYAARVSNWVNSWAPTLPSFIHRSGESWEVTGIVVKANQIEETYFQGMAW